MHAEAVIFDFMQPLVAVRRFFDELRQLRPYPVRQSGGIAARAGALPVAPCREREGGLCAGAWTLLGLGRSRRAAVAIGCQFR